MRKEQDIAEQLWASITLPGLLQLREHFRQEEAKYARFKHCVEAAILKDKRVVERVDEKKHETKQITEFLTVTTGNKRTWDQAKLLLIEKEVEDQLDADSRGGLWPFKKEQKEVRKDSSFIEKTWPNLWAHIAQALTTTPKTPTIAIKNIEPPEDDLVFAALDLIASPNDE